MAERSRYRPELQGFTLLELVVATTVLLVAVMAIGAIIVPISRQREQIAAKNRVLNRCQRLLEEIKGVAPEGVYAAYDGATYDVDGVEGAFPGDNEITVTVDDADPTLITVTVSGSWYIAGHVETLEIVTEIYSPKGQI